MAVEVVKWIPWLAALAALGCAVCCLWKPARTVAAPLSIAGIVAGFVLSVIAASGVHADGHAVLVHGFEWLRVGTFRADFAWYVDPLTIVMLYVVTGIGSLVAIYASSYMKGDRGYARFFFGVSLFIFSMTCLVLADNLVLLYLGWEGVGLCSYLLIGYYYEKPSAVAAGKKAFIVNRIGDLGFALGIFLTWQQFGTVQYAELFERIHNLHQTTEAMAVIPFLLMLGAFGKSAQFPLHVWLPDAMEGPTPVSALIHAATMVTAGVYMIARLMPLFELSPHAMTTVSIIGGITALMAATIALCQYDIKRVFAYSTVSQLGYMFMGIGAASSVGAVFHLFTHAFFKALLFLTAGSVMHAMAGQLDLRRMSGLREKMPVTCWLMFAGCLALAGLPPFAGFYSKDLILGDMMVVGLDQERIVMVGLALVGLFTAFLTAFYTFRLWFRLFMGPLAYEMGEESHDEDDHAAPGSHAPATTDITVEHHHEPHEMPWLMNGPLVVLALGAVAAGFLGKGWMTEMIEASSAAVHPEGAHHAELLGMDAHHAVALISIAAALLGVALAAWFHLIDRPAADRVKARHADLVRLLENKYWFDEIYDRGIVSPLRLTASVMFVFDRMVIDGVVLLVGFVPRWLGLAIQPSQRGSLQGYGLGMALGLALLLGLIFLVL